MTEDAELMQHLLEFSNRQLWINPEKLFLVKFWLGEVALSAFCSMLQMEKGKKLDDHAQYTNRLDHETFLQILAVPQNPSMTVSNPQTWFLRT